MDEQLVPPGWQGSDETQPSSATAPIPDLPPPPAPPSTASPRQRPWPIIGGSIAAVIVIITVVVALVGKANNAPEEITALGSPVENATDTLRLAERQIRVHLRFATGGSPDDIAVGEDVQCWFSYPEGEEDANDFLRCGPLLYADSAPDAYWVNLPVSYDERGGSTTATLAEDAVGLYTTHALDDGETLAHPRHDPPEIDDIDLARPEAEEAGSGEVAMAHTDSAAIDLDQEPEDGRLHGLGTMVEVKAFGYTDRVRLGDGEYGPGVVRQAAEGERWLVANLGFAGPVDVEADNFLEQAGPSRITLRVDDTELALPDELAGDPDDPYFVPVEDEAVVAFSVPEEAEEIALVAADEGLTQEWSFVAGERTGASPAVLYRDPSERTVDIDGEFTLPYAATSPYEAVSPSKAFGEVSVKVTVDRAALDFSVGTLTAGVDTVQHVASKPDRAFLHLLRVKAEWTDVLHSNYRIKPEDAVLTLEDGTKVAAQQLGDSDIFSDLFPGTLVWDVPADLQKATLTITPSNGEAYDDLDFRGGKIEIPLEFGG